MKTGLARSVLKYVTRKTGWEGSDPRSSYSPFGYVKLWDIFILLCDISPECCIYSTATPSYAIEPRSFDVNALEECISSPCVFSSIILSNKSGCKGSQLLPIFL